MNTITIVLIILAVLVMMGFTIAALCRKLKEKDAENRELREKLRLEQSKSDSLVSLIEKTRSITNERIELSKEIRDAETGSDYADVLSKLVALNNDRVRNQKADSTSAETGKADSGTAAKRSRRA